MTHTPIIAFHGFAGAGKDESFAALAALGWQRRSFADKLRAFVYAQNPTVIWKGVPYKVGPLVDAYGWEWIKRNVPEIRPLLQRTGTEAGRRTLHEDVWVNAVLDDLPDAPTAFTDCRFPNEATAARARGGLVVDIVRPGVGPAKDPVTGEVHESELAMEGYDYDAVIVNDGTVADLHTKVVALVASRWAI